jgi:hypothetical protein
MALPTKKRVVPSKKRSGHHHKRNDHYLKHYWPYLPMLFVVGLGLMLSNYWSNPRGVLGASTSISAASLLEDTNSERTGMHESNLKLNSELSAAATAKAHDMVTRGYWAHVAPDGTTPWSFINGAGYIYDQAGENLAYGLSSSSAVMSAWMHSPSHRENVLNVHYSEVGFGFVSAPNYLGQGPKTIVVAMYASPANSPSTVPVSQSQPVTSVLGDHDTAQTVSRLATLHSGPSSMLPLIVASLMGLAAILLISTQGRALHRSLVRSEAFVLHHPWLDVMLVGIITLGIVLSQSVGSIL